MIEHWSRESLAWLAGVLEGEGHFMVFRRANSGRNAAIRIGMVNTDLELLRRVEHIAGCGNVRGPYRRRPGKPMYYWDVGSRPEVYALAVALWPWLTSRRRASIVEIVETFAALPTPDELRQGHRSLSDEQVREIRRRAGGPLTYDQLGDEYGASAVTVGRVVRRETYRHVE